MNQFDKRLQALGLSLPPASPPAANYRSFIRSGPFVHIAGQISKGPNDDVRGIVGDTLSIETSQQAARLCGLNIAAQIGAACEGDFERLVQIVKLAGFMQCAADFDKLPLVMDGCSDLMVALFGDRGRHARSTVGVYRLPSGYAVEVDAVIEVRE
ncbi:RidA family protein [Parasphingopyxis sp.]|uniref:RidA family protein n=1 Tax=Parasphingopyxis sp. TaxID=1920299 RepID=UPI00261C7E8B|nr:RidA family protein [Parasphingopyxis sp.]